MKSLPQMGLMSKIVKHSTKFQQGALVMAPILSGAYIKWRFSLEEKTALESSQSLKFLYPFYPQQNIHHILNHRSPQNGNFQIQKWFKSNLILAQNHFPKSAQKNIVPVIQNRRIC